MVRKHTKAVVLGLRYLHKKSIMHRDIKGQNVLVDNNGTAKLTDFGASEKIHTVVEYATKDGMFSLLFCVCIRHVGVSHALVLEIDCLGLALLSFPTATNLLLTA